jgi:hypothetical protein
MEDSSPRTKHRTRRILQYIVMFIIAASRNATHLSGKFGSARRSTFWRGGSMSTFMHLPRLSAV